MATEGLLQGQITDEALDLMRKRIGYANNAVRSGYLKALHNVRASLDAFRRFAIYNGDENPMFVDRNIL